MLSGDLDEHDEEAYPPPPPPPPPPAAVRHASEPARAEPVPRSRSRSPGVSAILVCDHCGLPVRGQYYEREGVVVHSECFGEYRRLRRSRRSHKSPPSNRRCRSGRSPRPRKDPPPSPSIATPRVSRLHQETAGVSQALDRRVSSSPTATPPVRAPPLAPPQGALPHTEVFRRSGGEVDSSPLSAGRRQLQAQRASLGSSLAEEVAQLFIGDMVDPSLIPRPSADETEWLIRPGEVSILAQQASFASHVSSPVADAPRQLDTQSLSVSPDVAQPPEQWRHAHRQLSGVALSSICEAQEPSGPRAIRESSCPPQSSPAIPFDSITQPFIPEATSTWQVRGESPPMSRVDRTPMLSSGQQRPSTPPSKAISSRPPSPLTPVTNQDAPHDVSAIVPVPDDESDIPVHIPSRGAHRPPPVPGYALPWATVPPQHTCDISFVSQGVVTESNSPQPAPQLRADRGSQTTGLNPRDNAPFGRQGSGSQSQRGRSESASPPPLPCFGQNTELQELRREAEVLRAKLKRAEKNATEAQTAACFMRLLTEESSARLELAAAAEHPPTHWAAHTGQLLRHLAVAKVAAAVASAAADARLTCTVLPPAMPTRHSSPAPTPRAAKRLSSAALTALSLTPRARAALSSSVQRCGSRSGSPAPLPRPSRSSTPLC